MTARRASRLQHLPVGNGLLICALLLVLGAQMATLMTLPHVFIDEPWQANASWTWLRTGVQFDTIHTGTLDQFGWAGIRRPMIGALPWVAMFAIAGLGLFQARLVSLLFGYALIGLIILFGCRMYSLRVGLLAALILSVTFAFTQASHYARQDIVLSVCILGAFALALAGMRTGRGWLHFLSGLLLGCSIDVHQYAVFFVIPHALVYAVHFGSAIVRAPGAWLSALGLALGAAYFVAVHVLPAPDVYFHLTGFDAVTSRRPPLLAGSFDALLQALWAEAKLYRFGRNPLFAMMLAICVIVLARRRTRSDRLLLAWLGGGLLTLSLLNGKKSDLYAIHLYPYMALVIAAGAQALFDRGGRYLNTAARAALVAVIGFGIFRFAEHAYENRNFNYYRLTSRIAAHLQPGSRVMASPVYWLGLHEYDYRSIMNVPYYAHFNKLNTLQAIERDRPDYLLLDVQFAGIVGDFADLRANIVENSYKLDNGGVRELLARRATVVAVIDTEWHGPLHVVKLDWQGHSPSETHAPPAAPAQSRPCAECGSAQARHLNSRHYVHGRLGGNRL